MLLMQLNANLQKPIQNVLAPATGRRFLQRRIHTFLRGVAQVATYNCDRKPQYAIIEDNNNNKKILHKSLYKTMLQTES